MTNQMVALLAVLALRLPIAEAQQDQKWPASAHDVRSRFVAALQQVHGEFSGSQSTMAEVRELLGEPDDVITEQDRPAWPGHVTWCYGTGRHLSLPTLGAVTFDDSGKARWIIGGAPSTSADALPPESQLRDLLRTVDRVQMDYMRPTFNPRDMVAVVNMLRELGKDKALGVLREYSRVQSAMSFDGGRGAIILMRFLFSVPEGEVHHTTYLPFDEYKSPAFPAFPAVVIDGVPLYLFPLGGWVMGGGLPKVDEYLDWYAKHGALIDQPLRPVDDPRTVWAEWEQGPRKTIHAANPVHAEAADDLMIVQMLRMIDTVYPRQFDEDEVWNANEEQLWSQAMTTLQATPCRWDVESGRYVRAKDGSSIEPDREKQYVRVIWELPVEGRRARLVLHRISDDTVRMAVEQDAHDAPVVPNMKVLVFAASDTDRELTSIDVDGAFTSGSSSSSTSIHVPKGTNLQAQMIHGMSLIAKSALLDVDREIQIAD